VLARRGARSIACLAATVLLGGLFARTLLQIHGVRLPIQADAARRILEGDPYSSALQARLLGPLLVQLTQTVTGRDWQSSYEVVLVVSAVAVVVTMAVLIGRHVQDAERGLRSAALGVLAILLLQDSSWLHLWDLLDLVFVTIFAAGVFSSAGLRFFVPLFLVELCNRESAVFIPLWIVLSALPIAGDAPRALDGKRLLVGASGILFGLAAVSAVRAHLYRGRAAVHRAVTPWGNHVTLKHNAVDLWRTMRDGDLRAISVYLAVVFAGAFVLRARSSLVGDLRRVPLLLFAMALSVVAFGLILEARSWLFAVPFLLFLEAPRRAPPC
jgi:hypothetical protein